MLAPCALGALEFDIQGEKHWIWTGDKKSAEDTTNGIKQTLNGKKPTEVKATDGVVKFTNQAGEGANYFLIGQGQHIDKITLGGNDFSAFSFNSKFSVGEMIIKDGSFSHTGRWATTDTCGTKGTCSAISVDKLVLDNSAGSTSATFSLGAINAKTTEVKGQDANTEISITTTSNKGSYKVGLGDISVGNGKLKLGGDESIYDNFNLTLQENGKIDATSNAIITKKLQTLTLEAKNGVSYDLAGLTFGQQTTIQVATIATSDADYFANKDKAITTKITSTTAPQRYKSERKVIDNGISKHSGDEVTITAKDTAAGATNTYIANTTMPNYKVGLSDSLQAVLDAGFLARQILIADTMAINSKMMNYKNSQFATLYRSNARGDALAMRGDERVGDVWVDYDYSNLKDLGESNGNSLDIKSSAVQVGGGVVNSGSTKAAFFVRYTSASAKSTQIQNTYKASAINAGLFVAQSLWANGYLRGHFSFHNIGVKSDYTLQNTRTGDTSGSFKNGFNYLTTGIGVEQEANFTPALWANLAFDFNHLVALGKANNFVLDDEEEVPSAGADSLTMATFGATFGGKLSYNVILYARAQIGFALANYLDDEMDDYAELDGGGAGGGGAGPGGVPGGAVGPTAPTGESFSWSHYNFNGVVGDFGLGLAWQASRKLQVSLEGANLIYGGASSSFNTKLGVDFRF